MYSTHLLVVYRVPPGVFPVQSTQVFSVFCTLHSKQCFLYSTQNLQVVSELGAAGVANSSGYTVPGTSRLSLTSNTLSFSLAYLQVLLYS